MPGTFPLRRGVGGCRRGMSAWWSVVFFLGSAACGSAPKDDLFGGTEGLGTGGVKAVGQGGSGGTTAAASGGTTAAADTCGDPQACPSDPNHVACCTVDFRCGLYQGQAPELVCISPDSGGKADSDCPGTFALNGNATGCCRSNGTCGYLDPNYGPGCVDPVQVGLKPGKSCH
jgi:hypothetical protein